MAPSSFTLTSSSIPDHKRVMRTNLEGCLISSDECIGLFSSVDDKFSVNPFRNHF